MTLAMACLSFCLLLAGPGVGDTPPAPGPAPAQPKPPPSKPALTIVPAGQASAPALPAKLAFKADDPLKGLLLERPELMTKEGVSLRRLPDGRWLLISVGGCRIRNQTDADAVRRRQVALVRARLALLEFLDGGSIDAERLTQEKTKAGNEAAGQEKESVEWIRYSVRGRIRDCPEIATWESTGGNRFYAAIGGIFGKGEKRND